MEIVEIRDASEIDDFAGTYVKIFSGPPYNDKWTTPGREVLEDLLEGGKGYCFRAVGEGRTLGIIMCSAGKWNDGVHLFIDDLAVDPKHEGKGVGRMLVEHAINKARSEGMTGIELDVLEGSPASDFWKRMGFGYTNLRMMHRKP